MDVRDRIIALLADGRFHSGQALGKQLSLTRAAIWKHIRTMAELGLTVEAIRGKGYRLREPLELFDAEKIIALIQSEQRARIAGLEIHRELDSTSEYLKRGASLHESGKFRICLAEWQTAGRGRRGRRWISPYGSNLYCSLAHRTESSTAVMNGLSLAAGVGVIRALTKTGVAGLGLKWPNDILLGDRKLAGILVDVTGEMEGIFTVVTGVGINVRMPRNAAAAIDQPWTDLHTQGYGLSRNHLAGLVLDSLIECLARFSAGGLEPFLDDWQRYDKTMGRRIQLHTGNGILQGIARGIDEQGALRLEHQGTVSHYHSGEVSLRVAP